jgi:hypothetical protein
VTSLGTSYEMVEGDIHLLEMDGDAQEIFENLE